MMRNQSVSGMPGILHQQIGWHHAAGDEHGDQAKERPAFTPHPILFAQRIGHQHRHKQIQRCADRADEDGVQEALQHIGLLSEHTVCLKGAFLWKQHHAVLPQVFIVFPHPQSSESNAAISKLLLGTK